MTPQSTGLGHHLGTIVLLRAIFLPLVVLLLFSLVGFQGINKIVPYTRYKQTSTTLWYDQEEEQEPVLRCGDWSKSRNLHLLGRL
jgi:hypothetical protein